MPRPHRAHRVRIDLAVLVMARQAGTLTTVAGCATLFVTLLPVGGLARAKWLFWAGNTVASVTTALWETCRSAVRHTRMAHCARGRCVALGEERTMFTHVSASKATRCLAFALALSILLLCSFLLRPILLQAIAAPAPDRELPPRTGPAGLGIGQAPELAGATDAWWAAVQENVRRDDYLASSLEEQRRQTQSALLDPGPLPGAASWYATGEAKGDHFGLSAATAGDVNRNGGDNVIVGAPYYGGVGRVYVYGGELGEVLARVIFTATGESPGSRFGVSVASAGDVNGDGFPDIIVGADGYASDRGRVYVYQGAYWGLSATPVFTATGEASYNQFGRFVGTAGDVNGDGYADVIVGAPGYNSGQGRAYVYLGGAGGLSAARAFTLTGEPGSQFGMSVGTAGDAVGGDGYDEVIVGASAYSGSTGRAYVFRGGASGLSSTPVFTATGETVGSLFGDPVATAGDVNGDGYADV
ncbi:MAG: hypothetical protein FJ026_16160, partial [Chloroflexi bacterium]|nr:hypothetical protein [Chloroflexota bacterium]